MHLIEQINDLGGLDIESVHAQLASMKVDIMKFADKPSVVTPPLTTDVLI